MKKCDELDLCHSVFWLLEITCLKFLYGQPALPIPTFCPNLFGIGDFFLDDIDLPHYLPRVFAFSSFLKIIILMKIRSDIISNCFKYTFSFFQFFWKRTYFVTEKNRLKLKVCWLLSTKQLKTEREFKWWFENRPVWYLNSEPYYLCPKDMDTDRVP